MTPRVRPLAGSFHMIQNPGNLGGGKIRVNQQPRGRLHTLLVSLLFQFHTQGRGSTILPNNGFVYRPAGITLPYNGGFPLIGNADTGNLRGTELGIFQGLPAHRQGGFPDFLNIVLDPTIIWKKLGKFSLRRGYNGSPLIEDDRPGAGGSLVYGQ